MNDETCYDYFIASLPKSVGAFTFYYEDKTYNVNHGCEKYTKFELQQEACNVADGKSDDADIAMYGRSASSSNSKSDKRKKGQPKDAHDRYLLQAVP